MTTFVKHSLQLVDSRDGKAITASGGVAKIVATGAYLKSTLYSDKEGTSASNPIALVRGKLEFWTADTVGNVDMYIDCPNGHFLVLKNVAPMELNEAFVDQGRRDHTMVIPWHITDFPATVETDTGFDTLPALGRAFLPWPAVNVKTIDATETIDVGTDGSGANDPNGLIEAASVGTATLVPAVLANGAVTLGALLKEQDSANAGDAVPKMWFNATNENITMTTTAGSDTGAGLVLLPYRLHEAI